MFVIYLKCFDGAGYFTGIILTSSSREVGVHTSKARAYKFKTSNEAYSTAKNLKSNFKCIMAYDVIKL